MKIVGICIAFLHFALISSGQDPYLTDLTQNLKNISDTMYFTHRDSLLEIGSFSCGENPVCTITLSSRSKRKHVYDIKIETGKFYPDGHLIELTDTIIEKIGRENEPIIKCTDIIDGIQAFGIECKIPEIEIKNISLKIDKKEILIPQKAYCNLYEPRTFCIPFNNENLHFIHAFETKDGKYLHLYISGGQNETSAYYRAKLVFDMKKYITTIALEGEYTFSEF